MNDRLFCQIISGFVFATSRARLVAETNREFGESYIRGKLY